MAPMKGPLLPLLFGAVLLAAGLVFYLAAGEGPGGGRSERGSTAYERAREPETSPAGPARAPKAPVPPGPPRFAVEGLVTDPHGRPIAGAHLLSEVTDARGRCAVTLEGPRFVYDLWAVGYLPVVGEEEVLEGEGPWKREFVLQPAPTVRGRVTAADGAPVKGAVVYAIAADRQLLDDRTVANSTATDADGRYAFPGFDVERTDVGVRAEGFLPALVPDVEIARGVLDVVLRRGRSVTVVLSGYPPGHATVVACDSRLRSRLLPPGGVEALAGALVGRALVDCPVVSAEIEERLALSGIAQGPADFYDPLALPGEGVRDSTADTVTLRYARWREMRISVRDAADGNTLSPRIERLSGGAGAIELRRSGVWWQVPADGGRHLLRLSLDGYEVAEVPLPEAGDLDLLMHPVADGERGTFHLLFEPELRGRVAIVGRDPSGRRAFERYVDAPDREGRWTPEPVPVGEYTLSVLASGMVPVLLPRVVIVRGHKETFRVALSAGGGLDFRVTDGDGNLLDKVHLLLRDASGRQIDVQILTRVSEGRGFVSINYLPSAASARADSGLAEGPYTLTVYREGYARAEREFAVRGTDVAEVAIALRRE